MATATAGRIFEAVAAQVGSRLYVGAPGSPHCDLPFDCPEMTEADWDYACENDAECFGFVTADGTFYNRAEASDLAGRHAEAQALQGAGLL